MTTAPAGTSIGPYQIARAIGAGGWSTVYEVKDAAGQPWALKRLRDDLGGDAIARFHREVASLGRIAHPGVVRLIDAGVDGGAPYLVTPLLTGPTVRTALAQGPLVPEAALALVIAAAHAVGAIHAAGLVHRDLKPDNLVIDRDGAVIVIDLGLALGPEHSRHTAEDTLTGSVPYMAPEQIEDRTPSPASDVWALGVVLFEAIAGRRPFQRRRGSEEVAAILAGRAPSLIELAPAVSEALAALVARVLDPEPTRRPPDGAALAAELERLVDWTSVAALADERGRWLADPIRYAAEVADRRCAALATQAEAALAAGDRFAATRLVERGLGYRGDDPRLAAILERVMSAGGRPQARTIRGAAPAPALALAGARVTTPADARAPGAAPVATIAPARRWPWLAAGALALLIAVGLVAARPWAGARSSASAADPAAATVRPASVAPSQPAPAAAAGGARAAPTSSAAPVTGETRPAHVRPSRPAGGP
ncbi:MAG: serine/threonine protein kinase [Myxococcales bacterium]|nr:serine/threonine protein kinase [Myxococcales bacterium]